MRKFKTIVFLVCCGLSLGLSGAELGASATLASQQDTAMVVSANPLATKAGAEILRAGGSAVDAAIAMEAVLSLVEPQSSGLGGGGFMTFFDAKEKKLLIYDGRETAPASATPDMFLNQEGQSIGFIKAKNSGLSTGVPGIVSMLQLAHADYGNLAWGEHFGAASKLANDGFAISPRLQNFLKRFAKYIPQKMEEGPTDAFRYFYDEEGEAHPVGHLLKNAAYAETLSLISKDPTAFYSGIIADDIVKQVSLPPRAGGLNKKDLQSYSAQRRSALCSDFAGLQVCGPPPPSSFVAVAMIMGILQHAPTFTAEGADDPFNWTMFAEAQRLAYADRDHFVADPAHVSVPLQGMLDPSYLQSRAKLINTKVAQNTVEPGNPWAFQPGLEKVAGLDATQDVAGTTHFVVVDFDGNVVSMTASVESIFGSTRMAGGMFLNNQLTDFSFKAVDDNGNPISNSVAPGKRPRSSMSPTIVLDENGEFLMASGSPGGNSIIAYTAKTLVGVLAWSMDPQSAVDLPNMVARGDTVRIEKERAPAGLADGLRSFGHKIKESAGENSGLSVVLRNAEGELFGGVDPRREGTIEILTR